MGCEEQKRIWDYFQGEGADSFAGSAGRLNFLARQVNAERVLNIGVGDGTFERAAQARGAQVHCLDPSDEAIAGLRDELGLGDRARVGYVQEMPFDDDSMEVVVISEVLEHLGTDDILAKALEEIERVLRPGGRIMGTVPAREDLARQMVVCPDCGKQFHRWGHAHSFNVSSMKSLLNRWFSIRQVSERLFVTWSTLNWKGKLSAGARLLLHYAGIHGKDESIWFVAVKDEHRN
jgi:SAM-dependent methyltransferase